MKKLGFGCMRLPLTDPANQKSIDREKLCSLFDAFMERGGVYFDTAYFYHENCGESAVGECLARRHARSEFLLADKMPLSVLQSAEEMQPLFEKQLEDCCVEYFDYYLLHNIVPGSYKKATEFGTFEYLLGEKEKGRIRRLGFSFHGTPELLEEVLTAHPQMEFVQLQINYLDWNDPDVQSRRCYEIARAHGKDIIIMEPCKGGELAVVPEKSAALMQSVRPGVTPAGWAFRFAGGLDGVIMVLSGMNEMEQVTENSATFDSVAPLTPEEREVLKKTAEEIHTCAMIKCTGCRYCERVCPENIPIPNIFSIYNRYMRTKMERILGDYGFTVKNRGTAASCIGCRACEDACPQHIPVPDELEKIRPLFEGK